MLGLRNLRMLTSTRARSRSSVHFVDEHEGKYYHRRPRSSSRHSSVEGTMGSRPRSYSRRRRRPLYCDGADDTQTDGNNADRDNAKEELKNTRSHGENEDRADPLQRAMKSGTRRTTSGAADQLLSNSMLGQTCLPAVLSRSASDVFSAGNVHAGVGKQSQGVNGRCRDFQPSLSADHTRKLPDRARVGFVDPGYDVDSQLPSPPVSFAVPALRSTSTPSPLPFRTMPFPKMRTRESVRSRRYTEPPSPAYSNDGVFTAVPRQGSYERVPHNSEPLSPADSNQDSKQSLISIAPIISKLTRVDVSAATADSPDHPDHLAYLLSTAQIAHSPERKVYGGVQENMDERMSYTTPVLDSFEDCVPSCHEYTKSGSFFSSLDRGSEVARSCKAGFRVSTAEEPASSMDKISSHSNKDFYCEEDPLGRSNAMHDIFDRNELDHMYYGTQVDYQVEGRAHMQARQERRSLQEKEAVHP